MRQTDLLHEGHCLLMLMARTDSAGAPQDPRSPMDEGAFKSLFQFVEEIMLTALFHPIVAWKGIGC